MSQVTRRLRRAAAATVLAAGVLVTSTPLTGVGEAASYTPTLTTFDARLLADINHARAAHGLRRLMLVAGTTDVAHGWSCHMAFGGGLGHNPHLRWAIEHHGSWNWTTYGENVGVLPSLAGADLLFHAYMASPEHRANILDRYYRYVGIWSKRSHGLRYNTIDFVGRWASAYNYGYGPTRRTC